MAINHLRTPAPSGQKQWKLRHSKALVLLMRGADEHGRLNADLIEEVRVLCGYKSGKSVARLWYRYMDRILAGEGFRIQRKQGSGRPLKYSPEQLSEKISTIPLVNRRTLRSIAHHSGIPFSTLYDYRRRGLILRATSSVKPKLTDENVLLRKEYCLSFVDDDGYFSDLMGQVHVDEKWFYVMKITDKFYLLPEEAADPDLIRRYCKHKKHIQKVMFGAAVARPRQNPLTGEWWDGKIHLHPFIVKVPAQRASRNRPRGTLITKTVTVNRPVYRDSGSVTMLSILLLCTVA